MRTDTALHTFISSDVVDGLQQAGLHAADPVLVRRGNHAVHVTTAVLELGHLHLFMDPRHHQGLTTVTRAGAHVQNAARVTIASTHWIGRDSVTGAVTAVATQLLREGPAAGAAA